MKDNAPSRAFTIPMRTLRRLSWTGATFVVIATVAVLALIVWFLTARPVVRIGTTDDAASSGTGERRHEKADTNDPSEASLGLPQVTSSNALKTLETLPFNAFPPSVKAPSSQTELSIELTNLATSWNDRKLAVKFFIHYAAKDGGNQQGRFFLIAKGPSLLAVYPNGVLNIATQKGQPLFSPERGEFFSVSRFREVKADFGPYVSHEDVGSVQVVVLNRQGEILISEDIPVSPTGGTTTSGVSVSPKTVEKPKVAPPVTTPPAMPTAAPSTEPQKGTGP